MARTETVGAGDDWERPCLELRGCRSGWMKDGSGVVPKKGRHDREGRDAQVMASTAPTRKVLKLTILRPGKRVTGVRKRETGDERM